MRGGLGATGAATTGLFTGSVALGTSRDAAAGAGWATADGGSGATGGSFTSTDGGGAGAGAAADTAPPEAGVVSWAVRAFIARIPTMATSATTTKPPPARIKGTTGERLGIAGTCIKSPVSTGRPVVPPTADARRGSAAEAPG